MNAPFMQDVRIGFLSCLISITVISVSCNKKPISVIKIMPDSGTTRTGFTFDGTGSRDQDGNIVRYTWDFDDNAYSAQSIDSHCYQEPGNYSVKLTVTDNDKDSSANIKSVKVSPHYSYMLSDTASADITPVNGGYLAVSNRKGDVFEIFIAPHALSQKTTITAIALDQPALTPMNDLTSRGVRIVPEGLPLLLPATLKVSYWQSIANPEVSRIFQLDRQGELQIVPWQKDSEFAIQGSIYELDDFITGTPDVEELTGQMQSLQLIGSFGNIMEFESTIGQMLELSELLQNMGQNDAAGLLHENAKRITETEVQNYITHDRSPETCGSYLRILLRYGRVMEQISINDDLVNLYRELVEDLSEQCPFKGFVKKEYLTSPLWLEGGLSDPVFISSDSLDDISGGGKNGFWFDGSGFESGEGRFIIDGFFNVQEDIQGEIKIDSLFRRRLKLSWKSDATDGLLKIVVEGQGVQFTNWWDFTQHSTETTIETPEGAISFGFGVGLSSVEDDLEFELVDGAQVIQEKQSDLGLSKMIWTLQFEEDPCDPETTRNLCRKHKADILGFCQTLRDWMVVEDYDDSEPLHTCSDPDCSGAIAANQGRAPWVGITEQYSSSCDELAGDVACSIECYGWGESPE